MEENFTKESFIRELSILSGFTLEDTTIFLNSLIRLLSYCVEKRIPFVVRGFGSLKFSTIKARMGFHGKEKRPIKLPEATRVTFTLAETIRDIARETPQADNRQTSFLDE